MFKDLEHQLNNAAGSAAAIDSKNITDPKELKGTTPSSEIMNSIILNPDTMLTVIIDFDNQQITVQPKGNVVIA